MSEPVTRPIVPDRTRPRASRSPEHDGPERGTRVLPASVAAELARLRLELWRLRNE